MWTALPLVIKWFFEFLDTKSKSKDESKKKDERSIFILIGSPLALFQTPGLLRLKALHRARRFTTSPRYTAGDPGHETPTLTGGKRHRHAATRKDDQALGRLRSKSQDKRERDRRDSEVRFDATVAEIVFPYAPHLIIHRFRLDDGLLGPLTPGEQRRWTSTGRAQARRRITEGRLRAQNNEQRIRTCTAFGARPPIQQESPRAIPLQKDT